MTNTARTALSRDHSPSDTSTSACDAPPTRPPPPIRARARGMVRPVTRRRAPAVPPPVDHDDFDQDDVVELDPVLQNERNDEIWQRRVGVALRPRRRSWSHGPCRQCRYVEETGRLDDDFITLKPTSSCAVNEYVDEPSTVVNTSSSSIPRRLSDCSEPPAPSLKSSAKDSPAAGSSTSLRVAVAAHELGVTCRQCGGCRCASCRQAPCACLSADDIRCRCDRRRTVRAVLGVCVPCLWAVSTCRRHCTSAPDVCRCPVDRL